MGQWLNCLLIALSFRRRHKEVLRRESVECFVNYPVNSLLPQGGQGSERTKCESWGTFKV